jgi:DNA-binding NtrC family response regulator
MLDILVVDDEPGIRMGLAYPLGDAGHHVTEAVDGAAALKLIAEQVFDVVICDVRLPKVDGLTLLRRLHEESPSTTVVLMTAYARVSDAIAALRAGAYDYVTKPFDDDEFPLSVVNRIEEQRRLLRGLEQAREQLGEQGSAIVGRSPPMVRLLNRVDTIAQSDAPVLLTGESGTGKELIARALHLRSARAKRPFIAVNCAALPEGLIEAELFGHERGAFTGAVKKRDGRFKLAHGGTLLLDEVAEISLTAQAKLLRVLQEGIIEPLGTNTSLPVDVRIISATHQNLKERVAEGHFREDLYYRLNVLDLDVPPLRERPGDLPLLLEHFLRRFAPPGKEPSITFRAWMSLCKYPFPGNVREFANAIERAVVLSRAGEIDLEHLPLDISGRVATVGRVAGGEFQPLAVAAREFEREHILRALELAAGKRARAADLLGISRKNLWEKMRTHALGTASEDTDKHAVASDDEGDDR